MKLVYFVSLCLIFVHSFLSIWRIAQVVGHLIDHTHQGLQRTKHSYPSFHQRCSKLDTIQCDRSCDMLALPCHTLFTPPSRFWQAQHQESSWVYYLDTYSSHLADDWRSSSAWFTGPVHSSFTWCVRAMWRWRWMMNDRKCGGLVPREKDPDRTIGLGKDSRSRVPNGTVQRAKLLANTYTCESSSNGM